MKKTYFLIPGMIGLLLTTAHPVMAGEETIAAQEQLQELKAHNRKNHIDMKTKRQLEMEAVQTKRTAFLTEMAQLKGQHKAAVASGNVEQAKNLKIQMKQLKADHKEEAKQAREEFKANRQKYLDARKAAREEAKKIAPEAAKS